MPPCWWGPEGVETDASRLLVPPPSGCVGDGVGRRDGEEDGSGVGNDDGTGVGTDEGNGVGGAVGARFTVGLG